MYGKESICTPSEVGCSGDASSCDGLNDLRYLKMVKTGPILFPGKKFGTHTVFNALSLPALILHVGFDGPLEISVETFGRVRYPFCKEVRKYACEKDVQKSDYAAERHR